MPETYPSSNAAAGLALSRIQVQEDAQESSAPSPAGESSKTNKKVVVRPPPVTQRQCSWGCAGCAGAAVLDLSTPADMIRQRQNRMTLMEQRKELRNRLGEASVYVCPKHKRASIAQPDNYKAGFDWNKSTRDNYQAKEGSEGYGEYTEPYAAVRATLDHDYHGRYTLARQKEQDELIRAVLEQGGAEDHPWVVFTAGAMGAGKTHVMDWLCERGVLPLMVPIDADLFKAALPEWAGYVSRDPLTAGFHTRRESGYLVELAQEASLRARQHVWVDGSLRDGEWYQQVFARIRARHPAYRIAILYVAADRDTVYRRIAARAEETGRHVPRAEVDDSLARVPKSVERLAAQVEFLAGIDNSTDAPQLRSYFCEADDLSRDVDLRAAADDDEWAPLRDHFSDGGAPPPPVAPTLPPPGPRREPLTSKL
jgi:predicted ABC-type ATPase